MSEWKEHKLGDFAEINPTESLPKGTIAKKIAMEVLQPFTKRISSYLWEEYKDGVTFRKLNYNPQVQKANKIELADDYG